LVLRKNFATILNCCMLTNRQARIESCRR
jgi:hypothetical protein